MSNIIPLFNEYIGNDKIEEAVNLMLEFLVNRDAHLHGDFVLVKNRFSHFKREYKLGLTQDLSERVRIVHALLLLSEEVKQKNFPDMDVFAQEDHTAVVAAVYANVYATMAADIDLLVFTTHPENPDYGENKETHEYLFREVPGIEYRIKELRVENHEENYAVVRVRQQTLGRFRYPDFKDNECVFLHTMKPLNGIWKLYGTAVVELRYLMT
jgi:hypothetical protein